MHRCYELKNQMKIGFGLVFEYFVTTIKTGNMFFNQNLLLLLFFLSIGYHSIHAQNIEYQVLSNGGNTLEGEQLQLDWTLGELAILTLAGESSIVSQGLHQPSFLITDVSESKIELIEISVHPNPTSDWIALKQDFKQDTRLDVQLYSQNGSLLRQWDFQGTLIFEKLRLTEFPAGNYFLNIQNASTNQSQSFKIQKL